MSVLTAFPDNLCLQYVMRFTGGTGETGVNGTIINMVAIICVKSNKVTLAILNVSVPVHKIRLSYHLAHFQLSYL